MSCSGAHCSLATGTCGRGFSRNQRCLRLSHCSVRERLQFPGSPAGPLSCGKSWRRDIVGSLSNEMCSLLASVLWESWQRDIDRDCSAEGKNSFSSPRFALCGSCVCSLHLCRGRDICSTFSGFLRTNSLFSVPPPQNQHLPETPNRHTTRSASSAHQAPPRRRSISSPTQTNSEQTSTQDGPRYRHPPGVRGLARVHA